MKILFPKDSRKQIYSDAINNNAPKDFFYGSISSPNFDIDNSVINTRPSKSDLNISILNRLINKYFNLNFSKKKAEFLFKSIPLNSRVLSFTDWDSMNIAVFHKLRKDLKMICGFHGLYNFYKRTPKSFISTKKKYFSKALNNMYHIFFFGPEDRNKCIKFFNIPKKKTSIYRFGVDTDFWRKFEKYENNIDVLSIGSDMHRNYSIFNEMRIDFNLTLITRLNVKQLSKKAKILSGSKNEPFLTDNELRNYYNKSKIIVIPLRETLQPSGYSVALQAMACGKPVIMTKIKGLWDSQIFKNMKNIIFVPPNNPEKLYSSIRSLLNNPMHRSEISIEARKTALNYFSLERMNQDFKKLTVI